MDFGSDQLNPSNLPEDTTLTVPQAVVLDELSFASEQLQALELLHLSSLIEPNNTKSSKPRFSSDKDKAEQVLNRIAPNQQIQPPTSSTLLQ